MIPLRLNGKLVGRSEWPPTPENDPPRSLKSLARIVDGNLCHRCGTCIGICPTGVLSIDEEEYPVVKNLAACTDCELCAKVCPGAYFNSSATSEDLYGHVPDQSDMYGHFESAYLSYASDPDVRQVSSSGGLITGLLVSLLDRGVIDGAVVVTSDEKILWKGKPFLARKIEDIIGAAKSKYAISPTNIILSEIRETPGRYAVVGLPCQIHGIQKAMKLDPRIRERVILTVGLFCHAAIEHDPMRIVWDMLGDDGKSAKRFLSRLGKHPGIPFLEQKNGELKPVYFRWVNSLASYFRCKLYMPNSTEILNVFYRLYTPLRCFTCYDSTAEFADIAVGDPWMAPPSDDINFTQGYSFVLARTKKAVEMLDGAALAKDITLYKLKDHEARTANTIMGREKRWRAFRVIETLRRQGRPVPEYGFQIPKPSIKHCIMTEINLLTHIMCFVKRGKGMLLRLALSPIGYGVLWINAQKRRFRDRRRDRNIRVK